MDSGERTGSLIGMRIKTIKYYGMIFVSSVLAAVVAVTVTQSRAETVSSTGIPVFFLMAGLSVAAIVLAVIAISVSRSAERAIARKSEEISALQKEITVRAAAAAGVMESSVVRMGTEIAGAICSNLETLAGELQKNLPSREILRADITEAVEHSLLEAVKDPVHQDQKPVLPDHIAPEITQAEPEFPEPEALLSPVPAPVADEVRENAEKKYGEFKDIVLLGIANYPGVIARKIGEGHYRTAGDELADGVFAIQNEQVAVCTFCTGGVLIDRFMGEAGDSFSGFLRSLVNEIKCGHFSRIFMVFDGKLSGVCPYAAALNVLSSRIDAETFARFELFEGTPDVVIPELTERVSQLMEKPAGTEPEDVPEITFRRQTGA